MVLEKMHAGAFAAEAAHAIDVLGVVEEFIGHESGGVEGTAHEFAEAVRYPAAKPEPGPHVAADVVDVAGAEPGLGQAVPDGAPRHAALMLDAAEPFLGDGGHELSIHDQGGRGIVGEPAYPDDIHIAFLMVWQPLYRRNGGKP